MSESLKLATGCGLNKDETRYDDERRRKDRMGGGWQVMRCSFAHRDAFFSRKRLARGSVLAPYAGKERDGSIRKEEGDVVTSATAAQCVDEGGGWWVAPEMQALTHHRLLPACIFPGHI